MCRGIRSNPCYSWLPHPVEMCVRLRVREFPTPPSGGVNTPNFRTTPPPGFRGNEGERGREGGGNGKGEEKGREGTPKGWLTPPHVPNPEKYPGVCVTSNDLEYPSVRSSGVRQ